MRWYIEVLKKYAVFSGRARRKEYWYFILFNLIVTILLNSLLGRFGSELAILRWLYGLAVFLPSLGVTVRRLHDTGRSGWWILLGLVPVVGSIILLVFCAQDSHPGPNQYGQNPKLSEA